MAANSSGSSRSRPPPGFLTRIPVSDLKLLRVAIKRSVTTSGPPGPIERSIDDPKQLIPLVHIKKDFLALPDFIDILPSGCRFYILVNQEERFVLADANRLESQRVRRSRSHSHAKSQSPRKDRSASSSYRRRSRSTSRSRSKSRSPDKNRRTVLDRNVQKRKSLDRRSVDRNGDNRSLDRRRSLERDNGRNFNKDHRRSLETDKRLYRERQDSKERGEERPRRSSRTPVRPGEYRLSHSDLKPRSRERGHSRDNYRQHSRRSRSLSRDRPFRKSPSPDYQKPSTSRKRSRSPRRSVTPPRGPSRKSPSNDYEKPSTSRKRSRSPRRSVTPNRGLDKLRSARYSEASKNRRSRTPTDRLYAERKIREQSLVRKSPDKSRRSRTPSRYGRDGNISRSPHKSHERSRGSPDRYDRYSRRHSRSPDSHRAPQHKRRSRSPHAPIDASSRSRTDHRRFSRSPGYNRRRGYRSDKRSRSRSPRKHRSRSPHGDRAAEFAFYEGIPPYWIPAPIRPGSAVPRLPPGYAYSPGFFPRMPGGPIIIPPRMPMVPPYAYRQRLPIYNSLKPKPKVSTQPQPSSGNVSADAAEIATDASTSVETNVIIQEVSDTDSRKTEGSERRHNPDEESRDSLHEKD